jgi:hypothetical protein
MCPFYLKKSGSPAAVTPNYQKTNSPCEAVRRRHPIPDERYCQVLFLQPRLLTTDWLKLTYLPRPAREQGAAPASGMAAPGLFTR